MITFFGVTRADDTLVTATGTTGDGLPIYTRTSGNGFSLVIEGKPGASGAPVGPLTYRPDLMSFPDLQVLVSRPLGDGSTAVCDDSGTMQGGVPAIDPPSFDLIQSNIDATNDLGCRFQDGSGAPMGRSASDSCVLFPSGDFHFVAQGSTLQFCGLVTKVMEFPLGDTLVTARLQDIAGNPGPPARVVIRIGP